MVPLPLVALRSPSTVVRPRLSVPALCRVRRPVLATVPRVRALESRRLTVLPEAATAPMKLLPARLRSMAWLSWPGV